MRIIAGEYRGRQLKALKGDATRPTTDRVKESMMSSLHSASGGFDGLVILDAFAGTGALGLEALSRGAALTVFVDQSRKAQQILHENITSLKLPPHCHKELVLDSFQEGFIERLKRLQIQFDVVFLDPPYKFTPMEVYELISNLVKAELIGQGSLICYEFDKNNIASVENEFNGIEWQQVSLKKMGDTAVAIYRRM